jgi:hypothetical protein
MNRFATIFLMIRLRHEVRWTVRRGAGYDARPTPPAGLGRDRDRDQPPDAGTGGPFEQVPVHPLLAVGQIAARSAQLLGAERVVVIDRFDHRLVMAERELGVADPGDGPAARPAAGHRLLPKAGSVFVLGVFAGTVRGVPGIRPVQQQGRLRPAGVPV